MRLSFSSLNVYQDPGVKVATIVSRLWRDRPIKSHPCSRFNRLGRVGIAFSNCRSTDRRFLHMDLLLMGPHCTVLPDRELPHSRNITTVDASRSCKTLIYRVGYYKSSQSKQRMDEIMLWLCSEASPPERATPSLGEHPQTFNVVSPGLQEY
jgi:hypothetical protein